MSTLTTRAFWRDAIERAVKTAAQFALGAIGADQLDVVSADWGGIVSLAVGGAVLSILTSIGSAGKTGTASMV